MKRENLLKTSNSISNIKSSPIGSHFVSIFSLFIYKKSLRINEAVYLVTSHILDKETIKFNARDVSVKLSSLSIKLNHINEDKEKVVLYESFLNTVVELMTLLEVLFISGFIKDSNFNLINRELVSVYEDIKDKLSNGIQGSSVSIDQSFFNISIDKDRGIKDKLNQSNIVKDKDIKDIKNTFNNIDISEDYEYNKGSFDKGQKDIVSVSNLIEKTDRKEKILSFFADNKKLTIKDVAILLPEYGDKTIQRELLKMVKNGDLIKEGEKRWTVYFLPKK